MTARDVPLSALASVPAWVQDERDVDHWLCETRQIDLSESHLRITAQKLTQARQTLQARAAAIHQFVRRLTFEAHPESTGVCASEILRQGSGDCHTKGLLFVALCRAAGLPARLLFLRVRTGFLQGVLQDAPPEMPHAVGQVYLDGEWRSTDGYVVDPVLFARAKQHLYEEAIDSGWGIVDAARAYWDGEKDCLHQFRTEDIVMSYGVFHDPIHFYASGRAGGQGWLGAIRYAVGARLVNRRVAEIRAGMGE